MSRDLSATSTAQAATTVSDLELFGDPDSWKLVYKVSATGGMFSIKHCALLGAIQFSWKVFDAVAEAVVAINVNDAPALYESALAVPMLQAAVVKEFGDSRSLACLCMARSASGQFNKRTYTMRLTSGRTIVLCMTREGENLAMSATLCHF